MNQIIILIDREVFTNVLMEEEILQIRKLNEIYQKYKDWGWRYGEVSLDYDILLPIVFSSAKMDYRHQIFLTK
jgi:hypothetical protein